MVLPDIAPTGRYPAIFQGQRLPGCRYTSVGASAADWGGGTDPYVRLSWRIPKALPDLLWDNQGFGMSDEVMEWADKRLSELDPEIIVVVAFGASSRVARSAIKTAREEGIKVGMIRPITLWPFPEKAIEKTIPTAKKYLCVEMNMGQMVDDVRLVVNGRKPVEFFGRTGGVIPTPAEVLEQIRALAGKEM